MNNKGALLLIGGTLLGGWLIFRPRKAQAAPQAPTVTIRWKKEYSRDYAQPFEVSSTQYADVVVTNPNPLTITAGGDLVIGTSRLATSKGTFLPAPIPGGQSQSWVNVPVQMPSVAGTYPITVFLDWDRGTVASTGGNLEVFAWQAPAVTIAW